MKRFVPDIGTFTFLACAITWTLALPAAFAWMAHQAPSPLGIACAGLSAFGPLIAALLVASLRKERSSVFGRWRTSLHWVGLAALTPMAIHLVATGVTYLLLGGRATDGWFHFPNRPEAIAALVVFPLGEEFGWRGFLQGRATARFGTTLGTLLVGLIWGLWHLAYAITPLAAGFDWRMFGLTMLELPIYAFIVAWLFQRSGGSMAVAIAFHMGAHLDHLERAPMHLVPLHAIHLGLAAFAAILAARSLARTIAVPPKNNPAAKNLRGSAAHGKRLIY